MTAARPADRLGAALWMAVGVGLLADAYLPFARHGWLVRHAAGLLWPAVAAAALAIIAGVGLARTWSWRRSRLLLLAFAAVSVLAVAVMDLVPPIARDELTYHLAVPALYVRAGHTVDVPFIVHAYYPMLLEMLYVPLLAHLPEQTTKFLHLACGLGASALVFLYLQRRVACTVALVAAVLLLTTPTVLALGASAYVDLGLLLFSTVAVLGVLRWAETERRSDLLAGALGAGCAASVKYNGVLVVALLTAWVLLLAQRRGAAAAVRGAATFALVGLIPMLPWLLKNLWDTGNPVFPLLNGVFGGRPLPRPPVVDVLTYRRALYGETWPQILLTPLRVFVTGREGDPARFDGVFNPLYLLGFAVALRPGATRRERLLAGFAAGFLALAFFSTVFRSRYVLPVLVPLTLLVADWGHRWSRQPGARAAAFATVAAAALLFNAVHLGLLWQRIDPLAYVLGRQTRTAYVARFVPEYPVTDYANTHLPPNSGVYLAFLGSRGYYWGRPYTYDVYLSGTRLCDAIRRAGDGAAVAALLRQEGITHIASADPLLLRFVRDNLTDVEYERWQQFAAGHLRPVFVQNGVGLYELVGA